jgi:hypothetical protein
VRKLKPRGKVDSDFDSNGPNSYPNRSPEREPISDRPADPLAPFMDEALLATIAPLLQLNGDLFSAFGAVPLRCVLDMWPGLWLGGCWLVGYIVGTTSLHVTPHVTSHLTPPRTLAVATLYAFSPLASRFSSFLEAHERYNLTYYHHLHSCSSSPSSSPSSSSKVYPSRAAFEASGGEANGALAWPNAAEFVRVAAKYGALIVPLAGIGADESAFMVADAGEGLSIPGVPNGSI